MKASFGADISGLSKPSSVWMDDATYKDVSGKATFTDKETEQITAVLSQVGKTFNKINANGLRKFLIVQNGMTGSIAGASLKTYNNSKVRAGEKISNPSAHAKGYEKWVQMSIQKQSNKAKSDKGKKKYTDMQKEFVPQVIKEMSTISVGGNPLIAYELVLKDFKSKEARSLRTKLKQVESDDFRYISFDNSVPTIVTIIVRHVGKTEDLGDKIMEIFDSKGINTKEPIVAPDLTDLVFVRLPDEE